MQNRFEKLIKTHNMFQKGDSVVCGISGGSDSVCLLALLCRLKKEWDICINAVHINHGIRKNATRDETFVKELCENLGCNFYSKKFDVPQIAKREKISEELCGRNVRYEFFEEIAEKTKSSAILTAHNKNDNAETVLLHLIRGSAGGGIGGISYVRGKIKRPLLDFTKCEIENFLKSEGIGWVEDETNCENTYTRNKIRNTIIPLMKEINPSVEDAILRCASSVSEDNFLLEKMAHEENALEFTKDGAIIRKDTLILSPPSVGKRIVHTAIEKCGFEQSSATVLGVYSLKDKQSGKKFKFPCGGEALVEYDKILLLKKKEDVSFAYKVQTGERLYIKEADIYVTVSKEKPQKPYLEIADLKKEITVRNFMPGDRFEPFKMNGHKKLKEFFADKKIPQSMRNKIPVFTIDEKICAVGDMRCSSFAAPIGEIEVLYIKIER